VILSLEKIEKDHPRTYTGEITIKENKFNPDSNYTENFWSKILTLLCLGAFSDW
tara:strand:+ start:382 stop:543 length:162 start_codon:yes stop_codon:yes gene_type:complete